MYRVLPKSLAAQIGERDYVLDQYAYVLDQYA